MKKHASASFTSSLFASSLSGVSRVNKISSEKGPLPPHRDTSVFVKKSPQGSL
jgi:hypothetical protein